MTLSRGTSCNLRFKLVINSDTTWRLLYQEKRVSKQGFVLKNISTVLDLVQFECLLHTINASGICLGNDDIPEVLEQCKKSGDPCLYNVARTEVVGYVHGKTIRSVNCVFLTPQGKSNQCEGCKQFRSNLRARASHIRSKNDNLTEKTSQASNVPITKLSDAEKTERIKNLSKTVHNLQKKNKKQNLKLLSKKPVTVDQEKHDLLMKIVCDSKAEIDKEFPVGTQERVFWDQQLKACRVKHASGMRWHPQIIKWCISLFSKSPAAYEQLSKAGFIKLPCKSTLKQYINFTSSMPDINPDILELVSQEFDLENAPDSTKHVSLVWDEMKIKSGLAVAKKTGKLVGFCHFENGDMDFDNLACNKLSGHKEKEVATHIMVLMVRGILSHVNIPFLWYPCKTFSSLQLLNVVWKATRSLEDLGLKVCAWVCDGAATNRTFFSYHKKLGLQYKGVTYSTVNRVNNSPIYFICDVPHLLKTVRNNVENSHGNSNSRNLIKGGFGISWAHIVSTVKEDKELGLNKLYKVKDEHIHLSPQLRMRVRLAAQVLSSTMANAILARKKPELVGTAEYCNMFDSWFDCLNGRYLRQGICTRKPNLAPYTSVDDPRFEWLGVTFLGWLDEWQNEVDMLDLAKSVKNQYIISRQTMDGLKITTVSFIHLAKEILSLPEVQFLLPEKLNQDRLETFFGKMRRGCGDTDNPTVDQIRQRILTLIVAGQCFIAPKNRNCEGVDDDVELKKCFPLNKKLKK